MTSPPQPQPEKRARVSAESQPRVAPGRRYKGVWNNKACMNDLRAMLHLRTQMAGVPANADLDTIQKAEMELKRKDKDAYYSKIAKMAKAFKWPCDTCNDPFYKMRWDLTAWTTKAEIDQAETDFFNDHCSDCSEPDEDEWEDQLGSFDEYNENFKYARKQFRKMTAEIRRIVQNRRKHDAVVTEPDQPDDVVVVE